MRVSAVAFAREYNSRQYEARRMLLARSKITPREMLMMDEFDAAALKKLERGQ
jgi:hypothetical protein